MSTTKQNIIDAINFMNESDAEFLWDTILHMYSKQDGNIIRMPAPKAFYTNSSKKTDELHICKKVISLTDYITK